MMRRLNSHCAFRCAGAAASSAFAVNCFPMRFAHHESSRPARLGSCDLNQTSLVDRVHQMPQLWDNPTPHECWELDDVKNVAINHKPANGFVDNLAFNVIWAVRHCFDFFAGMKFGKPSERKHILRCVFLETVAGVPGMVAGMLRHMHSLRRMKRDHGWIHTLLEEAENERMHLLVFVELRKPNVFFRGLILLAQGIFFNVFFLSYLLSPRFCHRLVGYLEEEAVKTYTKILQQIDDGELPEFAKMKAPAVAVNYWRLPKDATFRDMIVAIRADEAGHRLVNHTFADMHERRLQDATNPFLNCVSPDNAEATKNEAIKVAKVAVDSKHPDQKSS